MGAVARTVEKNDRKGRIKISACMTLSIFIQNMIADVLIKSKIYVII